MSRARDIVVAAIAYYAIGLSSMFIIGHESCFTPKQPLAHERQYASTDADRLVPVAHGHDRVMYKALVKTQEKPVTTVEES